MRYILIGMRYIESGEEMQCFQEVNDLGVVVRLVSDNGDEITPPEIIESWVVSEEIQPLFVV